MSALSGLFSASVAAQTIRVGVPYIAAASGGVWSERAGVVNIALEGTMLVGAFASVVAHLATGSPWLGLGAGVLAGVAFAALHAAVNVYGRVDGIVAGITFNLLAWHLRVERQLAHHHRLSIPRRRRRGARDLACGAGPRDGAHARVSGRVTLRPWIHGVWLARARGG
jgi:hypothetical protein